MAAAGWYRGTGLAGTKDEASRGGRRWDDANAMPVPSESQILAPGSPASSARTDDQAALGGRLISADLEAGGPGIAVAPVASRWTRDDPPVASSLPTALLAIAALVSYTLVRMRVGAHDPLGVGLASVPLFFSAAFLSRRRALAVGIGTIAVTLVPIALDRRQWSFIDLAIVAELVVLVVAALALRAAMIRASSSAASEAAHEALLTDRLQAVLGVAERLTTTLDRDAILRTIVTDVNRALGTEGTTIRILDGDRAVIVASAGLPPDVVERLPALAPDEGWFGELVRDRRPIVDDGSLTDESERALYGGIIEVGSSISVPLVVDDRVIGALAAFNPEPHRWSPADVEFVVAVATHAAMAIHNADLFARTERWVAQLEVAPARRGPDGRPRHVESVAGRSWTRSGRSSTTTPAGSTSSRSPTISSRSVAGRRQRLRDDRPRGPARLKVGEGFTGWVAANGRPLLVADANADPRGVTIPGTDEIEESMLVRPDALRRAGHRRDHALQAGPPPVRPGTTCGSSRSWPTRRPPRSSRRGRSAPRPASPRTCAGSPT